MIYPICNKTEKEIKNVFPQKPERERNKEIRKMFSEKQNSILSSVALKESVNFLKDREESNVEAILAVANKFLEWLKKEEEEPF